MIRYTGADKKLQSGILSGEYPELSEMPAAASWSLMGGYTFWSLPLTRLPNCLASSAMLPIKVPQMPRM